MAYSKQTWANGSSGGTPVNATRLNHMESGIAAAGSPTLLVAAANASTNELLMADYVCDGVDDQVQIQAALNAARKSITTEDLLLHITDSNPYSIPSDPLLRIVGNKQNLKVASHVFSPAASDNTNQMVASLANQEFANGGNWEVTMVYQSGLAGVIRYLAAFTSGLSLQGTFAYVDGTNVYLKSTASGGNVTAAATTASAAYPITAGTTIRLGLSFEATTNATQIGIYRVTINGVVVLTFTDTTGSLMAYPVNNPRSAAGFFSQGSTGTNTFTKWTADRPLLTKVQLSGGTFVPGATPVDCGSATIIGRDDTVIDCSGVPSHAFGWLTYYSRATIENITFIGKSRDVLAISGVNRPIGVTIRNCRFLDFGTAGAIDATSGPDWRITANTFENCIVGVFAGAQTQVDHNRFVRCATGVKGNAAYYCVVTDNNMYGVDLGVHFTDTSTNNSGEHLIANNVFQFPTYEGILLEYQLSCIVQGNVSAEGGFTAAGGVQLGAPNIRLKNCGACTVIGNHANFGPKEGIVIEGCNDCLVSGNFCADNGWFTSNTYDNILVKNSAEMICRNNLITGNMCRKHSPGIRSTNVATPVTIDDSYYGDNPRYGLNVQSGLNNIAYANDLRNGGLTGAYNDSATSTVTTVTGNWTS